MKKIGDIIGAGVIWIFFLISFLIGFVYNTPFNFLSGIVGGIWLLCLGHWVIVLGGFIASLTMPHPMWWIIVSKPSMRLGVLYNIFANKNNIAGAVILCLIGGLYSSLLIVGWLALVFSIFFITSIKDNIILFPMLLYAYYVATSPFVYMASKEPIDNENTNLTMTIIGIGSILTVILPLLGVPLMYPLILLGLSMIIKTLFEVLILPAKLKTYSPDSQRVFNKDIANNEYNQDDNSEDTYEKCEENIFSK